LNNDIGVPITLLRLASDHEALVIELGANHAGEIDYLAGLAQPTVGVITNAAAAHLEGFGSLAGVVSAKGELLDHLPRAGTSVLNADDPHCADWAARARTEFVATFGLRATADCSVIGDIVGDARGSRFTMRLPDGVRADVTLPLLGQRNVVNALAAAAAAQAIGVGTDDIVAGLAKANAVRGRMDAFAGRNGATVIDDSYNANPASVRGALDYLAGLAGRRILVLGDMAELGEDAETLHAEIGHYARTRTDRLFAIGSLATRAADAFGAGAERCDSIESLRKQVMSELDTDTTVLIKGSRVMGLDELAAALAAAGEESRC
jgi:UDP-N-acetylmuramoyl-tripeptide--D-alanyl-D-alanine ligase